MAKKTSKPNLPQDVLDRARQQAQEGTSAAGSPKRTTTSKSSTSSSRSEERAKRRQSSGTGSSAAARRRVTDEPLQFSKDKRRRPVDERDTEYIAERLANPTVVVTEEQMRQEYGHVLRDLRSMFLLAVVLFGVLIVIAQFFV